MLTIIEVLRPALIRSIQVAPEPPGVVMWTKMTPFGASTSRASRGPSSEMVLIVRIVFGLPAVVEKVASARFWSPLLPNATVARPDPSTPRP